MHWLPQQPLTTVGRRRAETVPRLLLRPTEAARPQNHDRQGAAAGKVEADRYRGPVGRSDPTSAALSVGADVPAGASSNTASSGGQPMRTGSVGEPMPRLTYMRELRRSYQPATYGQHPRGM